MTVNLEKIFFSYILENKKYFEHVQPHFFKNSNIQFVYRVLKAYMTGVDVEIPSNKQIAEMVKIEDTDDIITKDMLISILKKSDLKQYNEEKFIKPKFNAWILINNIQSGASDIIDDVRELEDITNYDTAIEVSNRIKEKILESTSIKFDSDDSLGSDFDDVESHVQDSDVEKIRTGWSTLDSMLGSGWDVKTFNVLMGATNSGKSLWMQNIAVNAANLGRNVLYITLEMSEKKCMKRMGAMRLKIPINNYDEISKDREYIKERIDNLHSNSGDSIFSENKMGKIITKFYAAGTATINDFELLIQNLKEKRGIDIQMVVVDYITLIAPVKGLGIESNLYLKGKHLAEGLRAIGARFNCPVITGIQVAKDSWNASDVTLDKVPESKAIAETADTFFAIIRTEEMKQRNLYRLKMLKQRDGDFTHSQVRFDLNTKYLTIENDVFVDNV